MATLAFQKPSNAGATITPASADVAGDKVPASANGCLLFQNTDGSPHTATIVVPGNTRRGQAEPDIAIVLAAGAFKAFGSLDRDLVDPTDGLIHITYNGVTGVKITPLET